MNTCLQDVRLALRLLRRRPAFTATAVLTLAIGMGVNAVAFGVVNGLLLKGFASTPAEGVGRIATTPGGDETGYASLPEYQRFAEATRGALDVAAEGRSTLGWRHDGTSSTAWVLFVSSNYFSMVDANVISGQLRVERRSDGPPSVVIGERFWRRRLGSPPLAGLTLRLNDTDVSVAGVIPESFTGPAGIYSPDLWLPLDALTEFGASPALMARDTRWLFLMGRLQGQATPAQVQGLVETAAASMAHDWPATHQGRGARFRMLGEANSELRGLSLGAGIGMGIISLVLLLACFNVTNLLLARSVERERDMGIRAALGASPARLMRLVITEGFIIAAGSGALALVVTWWTQSIVTSFAIPIEMPQHIDLTLDRTVAGFLIALVFVAGVLPGLWPALAAARVNVSRVLGSQGANAAGGRPSALRRWLVGAQIAGSTAFVALAALLFQSYAHLAQADVGFARERLLVADLNPASDGYAPERSRHYVEALTDRVRTLPGIEDVAVADRIPFFIGYDRKTMVAPSGARCDGDGSCPAYPTYAVSSGYFRTMGIPLIGGRTFDDRRSSSELIVSEAFASKHWPVGQGVGQTLRLGPDGTPMTVVGVTGRTHTRGLKQDVPVLFTAIGAEQFAAGLSIVARTTAPPTTMTRPFIEAANAVDPNVSLVAVKSMEDRMAVQLWPSRTLSWMFSICGTLAAVLATVGLTGVVIHAVSRRTREFGVRVSVGATPGDLVTEVLRSSVGLLIPGLVTGLVLAALAARLARALFLGVDVLNPSVYLAVALAHAIIVVAACIGPAVRASRLDPLIALRAD